MNKSIFITGLPVSCDSCVFCEAWHWSMDPICKLTNIYITDRRHKSEHCPLTPLPAHKNLEQYCESGVMGLDKAVQYAYAQGYNDCLDEILKGKT